MRLDADDKGLATPARFLAIVAIWCVTAFFGGWVLVDTFFRFHGSIIIFFAIIAGSIILGLIHGLIDMIIRRRNRILAQGQEVSLPETKSDSGLE